MIFKDMKTMLNAVWRMTEHLKHSDTEKKKPCKNTSGISPFISFPKLKADFIEKCVLHCFREYELSKYNVRN